LFVKLSLREAWAVIERPARHRSRSGEAGGRYLKKDSTEPCRVIIFEASRPENEGLEIMLFETSKIITPPVESIDIALRE
jgi:hypothetical protein